MWTLSFTQRHDLNGKPFPGARAYFFDASTSDPIATYRDPTLATQHPNPVQADAYGVFPAVWIPDSQQYYGVRVTTAAGVILSDDAIFANIAPATSGGGDPPAPINPDAIFKTGDLKLRLGSGIHEGWLPLNGRTTGSSVSGADYASDEYEALFGYLWNLFSGAGVVGGAGASAAADWASNKLYTLPDMRGRVPAGLDAMDSSAAGILTGLTSLAQVVGGQSQTLVAANIPLLTTTSNGQHSHWYERYSSRRTADGGSQVPNAWENGTSVQTSADGIHNHQVGNASPTSFSIVQPTFGAFIYIKT